LKTLSKLFENNRRWAERITAQQPDFFRTLAAQQAPEYLWIGCSDSRVPANQIVGLMPGELFVHRNVANVVVHTDLNCLSVLQFAIDVLRVRHVIVCGHYGCGGVKAALEDQKLGLIDNWLRHVQDVARQHAAALDALESSRRFDRLCELNVLEQATHVCETTVVQDAWARGQNIDVHAWIYRLGDGRLRDLDFRPSRLEDRPRKHENTKTHEECSVQKNSL
jgi:carbonic anhydrase